MEIRIHPLDRGQAVRQSYSVPSVMVAALRERAAEEGVPVSEIVRQGLRIVLSGEDLPRASQRVRPGQH